MEQLIEVTLVVAITGVVAYAVASYLESRSKKS